MELLFWLWYYDSKFFFDIKSSIQFYKNSIILPALIHLFICFTGLYYLYLTEFYHCDEAFFIWQTYKIFFSFIFITVLFFFRLEIISYEKKEKSYYDKANQIYPQSLSVLDKADYWIKRNTLLSNMGIMVLFLSVISVSSSIFILCIYSFDRANVCDMKLKSILYYHSIFILASNSPLAVSCFTMLFTKLLPVISAFTCPTLLMKIRNAFYKDEIVIKPYSNKY